MRSVYVMANEVIEIISMYEVFDTETAYYLLDQMQSAVCRSRSRLQKLEEGE